MNRRRPNSHSRAFTLIEVVMSLLVLAILLVAVEASLVASTKAIPDPNSFTGTVNAGSSAVMRFTGELSCALTVTEMSPTAVTFTVPDRNGDGTAETIRYAWSGIAGDPLTRQYNGGAVGTVAPAVQSLQLQYDKTSQAYYTTSEGPETLVYSFTNTLLAQDVTLSSTSYPGQYIVPSWPSGTLSWRISRVKLRAHDNSSPDGKAALQLRTATPGGLPTNRILDSATIIEDDLDSNPTWVEYAFSNHSGLSPNNGYCLAIQYTSGSGDCGAVQKNTLSLLSAAKYIRSTTGGASWTSSGLDNLLIYVYGVPTVQNAASYNYFLQNVRLSMNPTTSTRGAIATTIKLLNAPQVAGP
jgi:prepilin-type N-terminal cleavage/methylation domain-containing protein